MTSTLPQTPNSYGQSNSKLTFLYQETCRLLQEIRVKIPHEDESEPALFPEGERKKVENALKKTPSVLFIGNNNCGKTSVLNELLKLPQELALPVHQTPCTSRIVKVKYFGCDQKPFIRLRQQNETSLGEGSEDFDKSLLEQWVVLSEEDKGDAEKVSCNVEVGLGDHNVSSDLLKSGIEFIDSPGRNGKESLKALVDNFLVESTVPLIVYIIDGKCTLRDKEYETLAFLQESLPETSVLYVCNKIEPDSRAKHYDQLQDPNKKLKVFTQLKSNHFIRQDEEDVGTSSVFYGVSAKMAKKARELGKNNEFSNGFCTFEKGVQRALGESLARHASTASESLFSALIRIKSFLEKQRRSCEAVLKVAKAAISMEEDVSRLLVDFAKRPVTQKNLTELLAVSKPKLVDELEECSLRANAYAELVNKLSQILMVDDQESCKTKKRDFLFAVLKSVAPNISNVLASFMEASLRTKLAEKTKDVLALVEKIEMPSWKQTFCQAYGIANEKNNNWQIIPGEIFQKLEKAAHTVLALEEIFEHKTLSTEALRHFPSYPGEINSQWKDEAMSWVISLFDTASIASKVTSIFSEEVQKILAIFNSSSRAPALEKMIEVCNPCMVSMDTFLTDINDLLEKGADIIPERK